MEIVVIDTFVVPGESRTAFLETSGAIQAVIKTLPGFVEGYIYERTAGDARHNLVTTAVWTDEDAFEGAKKEIPARLRALGINPQETMKALDVHLERGLYTRLPY